LLKVPWLRAYTRYKRHEGHILRILVHSTKESLMVSKEVNFYSPFKKPHTPRLKVSQSSANYSLNFKHSFSGTSPRSLWEGTCITPNSHENDGFCIT
jgi:hypothetical protein